MTQPRRRERREEATISFPPIVFEWVEEKRGFQSRSEFVCDIIREKMKAQV